MKIWVYLALSVIIIGALTGLAEWIDQGGYNRAVLEQSQLQMEIDLAWREKTRKQREVNDSTVLNLMAQKQKIRIVEKEIIKKVSVYVKDDINCNLTRGAVELHNRAYGYAAAQGMPESASLSETEARKTSTTTQREFSGLDVANGAWCIALEASFDSLAAACP